MEADSSARGKRLSLQAQRRDLREDQGIRTLAEAGAGGGGGQLVGGNLYSIILTLCSWAPPAPTPAACGCSKWARGCPPTPNFPVHSLKGWGGSREAHILAFRRAGLYCVTLLKLLICSLNNSVTNLSRSIRRKTKPNPAPPLHWRQARRLGGSPKLHRRPAFKGSQGLATFQKRPGVWFCTVLELRMVVTFFKRLFQKTKHTTTKKNMSETVYGL